MMRIRNIYDGRTTYIEFLTWLYTDSHAVAYAYAVLNAAHTAAIEGMAARFGAMVLPGNCPRELGSPAFHAFDVPDHDDFQLECAQPPRLEIIRRVHMKRFHSSRTH
jgi:hypothetical protein